MHLGLTKSRDDKLLQDLLDKKLRVIVVFEDDYLNHIARIAYKDIQQDNYTYRIGEYNIYKGEEWGFCDFCKRHDCYFIVPNETIEGSSSEISNDLEEAAKEYAKTLFTRPYSDTPEEVITIIEPEKFAGFIAGAKWQKEQDEKEQADLFTIVALDAAQRAKEQMMKEAVEADVNIYRDLVAGKSWAEFVVEMPTNNLGDKVRVIIVKED